MNIYISKDNIICNQEEKPNGMDPAANLLPEYVIEIFSHLTLIDLAKCCRLISKKWTHLAFKDDNWRLLLIKLGISFDEASDYLKAKELLGKHQMVLAGKIIEKFDEFVEALLPNQRGNFTVCMPFNPSCFIDVELSPETKDNVSNCKKTIMLFQKIHGISPHSFSLSGWNCGYKIVLPVGSQLCDQIHNFILVRNEKLVLARNERLASKCKILFV